MAEPEVAYSFTLPSIEDDTPLDCRIYHPKNLDNILSDGKARSHVKGAIIAHPYAPLGGCFDDAVVLSISETLVDAGFVVGTFNFRGAAGSSGRTSWSGKAEQGDYMSFAGFLVNYLHNLLSGLEINSLEHRPLDVHQHEARKHPSATEDSQESSTIHLLLGGYSYGSLVLARLPTISTIMQRFETAEEGTAAAEINLRAATLATETRHSLGTHETPSSPRGRQLKPEDAATSPSRRTGASPIMVGGEETDPSMRRRSRDSRRSTDLMRKSMEKVHLKRQTSSKNVQSPPLEPIRSISSGKQPTLSVSARYLVVSPVILPFTHSLCPPGPPGLNFGRQVDANSGAVFLNNPTLAVFGSKDAFTSSNRLKGWAERQSSESHSTFEWAEIQGAGHFWREDGAMQALQSRIVAWVKSSFV